MESDKGEPFPLHVAAALSELQVRAAELDRTSFTVHRQRGKNSA